MKHGKHMNKKQTGGTIVGLIVGLLIGLGFSRGADYSAGNGFCHGQTGRQFSGGCRRVFSLGFFAAFFRTFNHIAVGITLTFATIAATTLTA